MRTADDEFRIIESRMPEVRAMQSNHHQRVQPTATRHGFTLVEMLVAVTLVLLMMTMFAEIFTLATGSMSKQKGLAELDQRQRLTSVLIREDIQDRTFRLMYPYTSRLNPLNGLPADDGVPSPVGTNYGFGTRQGYFYISENDPDNDADDILQFTMNRLLSTSQTGAIFYGRTRELRDDQNMGGAGWNPNQPENDDGDYFGDGAGVGTSPYAEVAYFVRNKTLFRRLLLVRNSALNSVDDRPMSVPPFPPLMPPTGPVPLMQPGIYPIGTTTYVIGGSAANRFPQDFDYSATYDFAAQRVEFLGRHSLDNSDNALALCLGRPEMRFGFRPNGRPMEYLPAPSGAFIGRYTQEETSHNLFAWPGDPGWGADSTILTGDDTGPYTIPTSTPANGMTLSPSGRVNRFIGGPRQGEDLLLTNVLAFDVKVWDPRASVGPDGQPGRAGVDDNQDGTTDNAAELGSPFSDDGAFADIGHTGTGDYAQSNNFNTAYGPLAANNRCFDTWHPALMGSLGAPPFRPARPGPDGLPGIANFDDDNNDGDNDTTTGADNPEELGWPHTDDVLLPMKAIQIKIRYLDVASGLVRDVTLIETF